MPCRYGCTADHRIPVELVEADVEIGFHLIDLAEDRPADAPRLLGDAEAVYTDTLTRIGRLAPPEQSSFEMLVAELRRAIDAALARHRRD